MDRGKSNKKPPTERSSSVTAPGPGYNDLYPGFYGSSGQRSHNSGPVPSSSADESLYPSTPYQQHMRSSNHPGQGKSFHQNPHDRLFPGSSHNGWQPPPKPPPSQTPIGAQHQAQHQHQHQHQSLPQHQPPPQHRSPPQHQPQPQHQHQTRHQPQLQHQHQFPVDPFQSIWSVKSSEVQGAGVGVPQQKHGDWLSGSAYVNQPNPVPSGDNSGYGGYDQMFGSPAVASVSPQVQGYPWSTCDGVTDSKQQPTQGYVDFSWDQSQYSPVQYSGHQGTGSPVGMRNGDNQMNEWELQQDEFHRRVLEADMKGRQERREWRRKGVNYPDLTSNSGLQNSKLHTKEEKGHKVVKNFLEKYRDMELPAADSSIDSESLPAEPAKEYKDHASDVHPNVNFNGTEKQQVPYVESIGFDDIHSKDKTEENIVVEDIGAACIGTDVGDQSKRIDVESMESDNICRNSESQESSVIDKSDEQVTSCHGSASDLAGYSEREINTHPEQVKVSETHQSKENSTPPAKKVSNNGKIRPGKRKPKKAKDNRRTSTPTPKSESKKDEKETIGKVKSNSPVTVTEESIQRVPDKGTENGEKSSSNPTDSNSKDKCSQSTDSTSHSVPCHNKGSAFSIPTEDNVTRKKANQTLPDQNITEKELQSSEHICRKIGSTTQSQVCKDNDKKEDVDVVKKNMDDANCKQTSSKHSPGDIKELSKKAQNLNLDLSSPKQNDSCDTAPKQSSAMDNSVSPNKKELIKSNLNKKDADKSHNLRTDIDLSLEKENKSWLLGKEDKKEHNSKAQKFSQPTEERMLHPEREEEYSSRSHKIKQSPERKAPQNNSFAKSVDNPKECAKVFKDTKQPSVKSDEKDLKKTNSTSEGKKKSEKPKQTSGAFFDPKRIFGGNNVRKVETETPKKTATTTDSTSKGNVEGSKENTQKKQGDSPAVSTSHSRKAMNGTVPSLNKQSQQATSSLPQSRASNAPMQAASSSIHPEVSQPVGSRGHTMYSFKRDEKTGVLTSCQPKVEEPTLVGYGKGTDVHVPAAGKSAEPTGERRCSGDSHMDGFHHPFGCSAGCYKRSSHNDGPSGASEVPKTSSSSSRPTVDSKDNKPKPHAPKQNGKPTDSHTPKERHGEKSKEDAKRSAPSPEKREKKQHHHTSASQPKRPTRATYSQPKHQAPTTSGWDSKSKEKETDAAFERKRPQAYPTGFPSASSPTPPPPAGQERKQETKQETGHGMRYDPGPETQPETRHEDSSDDPNADENSDGEEDLARQLTNEWWFKLGKKVGYGLLWLVLFASLLCLVVLSFLWAVAKKVLVFGYYKAIDLWAYCSSSNIYSTEYDNIYTEPPGMGSSGSRPSGPGWRNGPWRAGGGARSSAGSRSQGSRSGAGANSGPGSSSGSGSRGGTGSSGGQGSGSGTGSSWGSGGNRFGWGRQPEQPSNPSVAKDRTKITKNIDLPTTEESAIQRILGCSGDNLYEIMGVAEDASEDDMKKFYRRQCMLVHPDKSKHSQANEAFQILQNAYATLSDETKRQQYDHELNYKEQIDQMEDKLDEFFRKMSEMENMMPCGMCSGTHRRYPTELPLHAARYCATHNDRHAVKDGALWKETANFGFKVFVYHCDGHHVYDVTEWGACQELQWMTANSCQLQCRVKRSKANSSRQQTPPQYQDVFDNVFGSGAYQQFHHAANQQSAGGGATHQGGGGASQQGGSSHGNNNKQSGGGRNSYNRSKKSRKKKK